MLLKLSQLQYLLVYICVCHGAHVAVRGQPGRVHSFLASYGSQGDSQVIRVGGRHHHLPSDQPLTLTCVQFKK